MFLKSLIFAAYCSLLVAAKPVNVVDNALKGKNFEWFGVNESGPEFGEKNFTGIKGKEYQWPTLSTIDTFIGKGMNTFRINILSERLIKGKDQRGPIQEQYMNDLKTTVEYITKKGAYAMIVPHNYGRWYGEVNTDVAGFGAFWKTLARPFKANKLVIFDTNNEFHTMPQDLVVKLNQAAIDAIRSVGATTQSINVEGNAWSGAWHWLAPGSQNAATMAALKDPQNNLVYHMHQYLDADGSGTGMTCVSRTVGEERLKDATKWLRENKKVGLIGEYAAGDNEVCRAAVEGMLKYMVANKDVWKGAIWWAAGPWWVKYEFSMEPGGQGKAGKAYLNLVAKYA